MHRLKPPHLERHLALGMVLTIPVSATETVNFKIEELTADGAALGTSPDGRRWRAYAYHVDPTGEVPFLSLLPPSIYVFPDLGHEVYDGSLGGRPGTPGEQTHG